MSRLLPPELRVSVTHSDKKLTSTEIDRLDHLVIVVPANMKDADWSTLPHHAVLKQTLRQSAGGIANGALPSRTGVTYSIGELKSDASAFARLTLARKLFRLADGRLSIGLIAAGYPADRQQQLFDALVSAGLAAAARLPSFKSKPAKSKRVSKLALLGVKALPDLKRLRAEAEGNQLARWLSVLPANKLNTRTYRALVKALADQEGWQYRFLGEAALKKEKAGAFLAVAQGSPDRNAGIVHLKYRPAKSGKHKLLSLVGKGICFDTGGTNLKPHESMLDMHEDMGGSATALGVLLALSRMKAGRPVDCWLALSENMIGNTAYKPQDVITASNGVTIQVIHTDAEGRMVLADTLALASRDKPGLIIDFATLTGSCVRSLTTRMSGVFTNRDDWREALIKVGRMSGERVWPFSIDDEDYDEALESEIADIKQCATDGMGDHIYASRFLRRFVPDSIPWIHIDLGAAANKGGLAHIPTRITGFGVRYTIDLLEAGIWND